mmetsp:Transcript_100409/g.284375  ORF Transcript_100409/g.284375 Transcript_100409/m.284375 type:complete len:266 (-) Transcript_100409:14-811(-)
MSPKIWLLPKSHEFSGLVSTQLLVEDMLHVATSAWWRWHTGEGDNSSLPSLPYTWRRTMPLRMKKIPLSFLSLDMMTSPAPKRILYMADPIRSLTSSNVSTEKNGIFQSRTARRRRRRARRRAKRPFLVEAFRTSAPNTLSRWLSAAKKSPPATADPSMTQTASVEPASSLLCRTPPKSSMESAKSSAPPPKDMRTARTLCLGRHVTPMIDPMFSDTALRSPQKKDSQTSGSVFPSAASPAIRRWSRPRGPATGARCGGPSGGDT